MICTDDFVFIHYPKTGGYFVASVLETLLARSGRRFEKGHRHDTCGSIPKAHRRKPILSCVRNPYDLRVSQYRYRWWKSREARPDTKAIRKHYWPYQFMSFEQFVDAWDLHLRMMLEAAQENPYVKTMGQFSIGFISFFARHPAMVYSKLSDTYLASEELPRDLFEVHFLRTERLNDGLCDFLLSVGYGEEEVAFIRNKEKIQPPGASRKDHEKWEQFYTPGLKDLVRHRERMLFQLFPEYDL